MIFRIEEPTFEIWKKVFYKWHFSYACSFQNLFRPVYSGQWTYRVFERKTWCFELLLGHQKCTFKSYNWDLYISEMRKFDLWPLDLVENNIHVLHSLRPEWWQNFTWNSIILFRIFFSLKHQNKVILAISLLISRT